jgi:hypothetical protein
MSPERSLGQHWPSVVLGLLEAGQPQDTLTGGIANQLLKRLALGNERQLEAKIHGLYEIELYLWTCF